MKASILSWAASAALHGALAALGAVAVVELAATLDHRGSAPSGRLPGPDPIDHSVREPLTVFLTARAPAVPEPPEFMDRVVPESPGSCRAKGESLDLVSDKPFRGKGVYDVVAGGGGGGGRYGTALSPDALGGPPRAGISGAAERDAVQAALGWLARHQGPYGTWHGPARDHACHPPDPAPPADLEVATTALALLAFLEAGITPGSSLRLEEIEAGRAVREGIQALLLRQAADGRIGPRVGPWMHEGHALATLALVRAYRLGNFPALVDPAERAIRFMAASPRPEGDAVFWRDLALAAAWATDLRFPRGDRPDLPRLRGACSRSDSLSAFARAVSGPPAPPSFRQEILSRQATEEAGCARGSWAAPGGRAAATALLSLALLGAPGR